MKLEDMPIDQLFDYVIQADLDLLHDTLNCVDELANFIQRNPDKAASIKLIAQPLIGAYDIHKRKHELLKTEKQLWQSKGYLSKKLDTASERKRLLAVLEEHTRLQKTLSAARQAISKK